MACWVLGGIPYHLCRSKQRYVATYSVRPKFPKILSLKV